MAQEDDRNLGEQVRQRIAEILRVMSKVGSGDYSSRVASDLPQDHPLSTLCDGINKTIDSLEREYQRSAASQRELEEKLSTIEAQRAAIRELSTPIIEVWEGVLCLPVVGVLDS